MGNRGLTPSFLRGSAKLFPHAKKGIARAAKSTSGVFIFKEWTDGVPVKSTTFYRSHPLPPTPCPRPLESPLRVCGLTKEAALPPNHGVNGRVRVHPSQGIPLSTDKTKSFPGMTDTNSICSTLPLLTDYLQVQPEQKREQGGQSSPTKNVFTTQLHHLQPSSQGPHNTKTVKSLKSNKIFAQDLRLQY